MHRPPRWLPLLLLILLLSPAPIALAQEPLQLGVLLYRPADKVVTDWQAVARLLSERLEGRRVELQIVDYEAMNRAVARQELDFVLTQPAHYILLARRHSLSAPLATMIRSEAGQAVRTFGGVIITRADNRTIRRLEDLRSRHIATVTRESLGGWMMQRHELAQRGIHLAQDNRISELGMPHDGVVAAVLRGEVEVGLVRTGVLEAMAREGKVDISALRIINPQSLPHYPYQSSTRLYPEWPVVALPHVSEADSNRMAAALLTLPLGNETLAGANLYGFTTPMNYEPVEGLLRSLRLPPFEASPEFTAEDVWQRYTTPISLTIALLLVILVLFGLLWFSRHRLKGSQWSLRERVKEAECLRDIAQYLRDDAHTLPSVLTRCVERIPAGWLYPQFTSARLRLGEVEYCSSPFSPSSHSLQTPVVTPEGEEGRLEVFLSTEAVPADGQDFLPEERQLLHTIAQQIAQVLQLRHDQSLLRASEQRFRAMVMAMPDILFRHDAEGRYLDYSVADPAQLLVPPEAFIGKTVYDVLPPELAERAMEHIRLTLDSGEVSTFSYELPLSGELRHFELRISRINEHEVLAIARDVTSRHRIEAELKRSNAELEQFAYAVSHDMRQPLRMISGHLGILQRGLTDRLDEDEAESFQFALDGAKRMDGMIVSLLDYSRVGRKTEPLRPIQTQDCLDEALNFLSPAIEEAKATIRVEGEWPELTASRDELTRLLQNLIGNAVKYRHEDSPPEVTLLAKVSNGHWRVQVCDNGIGIDPDQTDRLFKVFSRLTSRGSYEGSGVGLALCRKIVEHHGGRIGVVSDGPGKGSCFWFELPLEGVP